jgi:hypothetical protein
MAELQTTQRMLQARVKDTSPEYLILIDAAIEQAWATLASMGDWWFLQQPKPVTIDIVADTYQYTIAKKSDEIGRMLYIANDKNRKVWTYKGTDSYQAYRTGGGIVRNVTNVQTSETGTIQVFTTVGLASGKPVIEVYPTPVLAATNYLHYREAGTLANLDKLPNRWGMVLFHFAMSILAPPQRVDENRWRAINYEENSIALDWLSQMAFHEETAVDGEEKEIRMDARVSDELDDIGDLS